MLMQQVREPRLYLLHLRQQEVLGIIKKMEKLDIVR